MDKIKKMTLQIFHTVSRKLSWSQISEHFTIIKMCLEDKEVENIIF